jgi:hypothetical protein
MSSKKKMEFEPPIGWLRLKTVRAYLNSSLKMKLAHVDKLSAMRELERLNAGGASQISLDEQSIRGSISHTEALLQLVDWVLEHTPVTHEKAP